MKIKLLNGLLIIDILSLLLILAIVLVPTSWLRIILGLPFLLFFPGFVLVEALFTRRTGEVTLGAGRGTQLETGEEGERKGELLAESSKQKVPSPETSNVKRLTHNSSLITQNSQGMDSIERVALSFGMSIAITALIGLGLNYTPWGIRLLPVLISISAFILILSGIALFRQYQMNDQLDWTRQYTFKMPGWEGSKLNKALTVILVIAIVGAVGTLIYTVAMPKVGERFTEFYILGLQGKAADYPFEFVWDSNQQMAVRTKYGDSTLPMPENYGRVTLGIVNQEQQKAIYTMEIKIDNQTANLRYQGQTLTRLEGIELVQGQKWENEIGFAPSHTGDNQKVEFLLYKDGGTEVYNTLHLWVNVVEK